MGTKMLIDASQPEETRVVVARGTKLEEFDFESASKKPLKGNIYLAKVTRVEPSLQAAFVEYGGNRHGFLAFAEIHPDYYQIPIADRQALIAEQEAEDAEDQEDDEEHVEVASVAAQPENENQNHEHSDPEHEHHEHAHDEHGEGEAHQHAMPLEAEPEPAHSSDPVAVDDDHHAPESAPSGEFEEVAAMLKATRLKPLAKKTRWKKFHNASAAELPASAIIKFKK